MIGGERIRIECRIAAMAMTDELRLARVLGATWREAMDSAYRVLDEILDIATAPERGRVRL